MSVANPNGLDYTTPVFIHNTWLLDGHDDKTPSATGTFVKFDGKHFLVTCSHVLEQADPLKHENLAIMCERIFFNLSYSEQGNLVQGVHVPKADFTGFVPDIAIANVDHCFHTFADKKGKKAIDLDKWTKPHWDDVKTGIAYGWLDGYKIQTEETLGTQGVTVTAEMGSRISPANPQFTLFSEGANRDQKLLSGISGGVVFTPYDGFELPIGIVFEGFPGGPGSADRPEDAYTTMDDIMVRGHVLTPDIFLGWLRSL